MDGGDALGRLRAGHEGAPEIGRRFRRHGRGGEPARARLRRRGKVDFAIDTGQAWEFPDAASAARFVTNHDEDRVPPTWRFGDAGPVLSVGARAKVGGITVTGVEATAEGAAGARTGHGLTTLYIRARLDSSAKAWLPGDAAKAQGPSPRRP